MRTTQTARARQPRTMSRGAYVKRKKHAAVTDNHPCAAPRENDDPANVRVPATRSCKIIAIRRCATRRACTRARRCNRSFAAQIAACVRAQDERSACKKRVDVMRGVRYVRNKIMRAYAYDRKPCRKDARAVPRKTTCSNRKNDAKRKRKHLR